MFIASLLLVAVSPAQSATWDVDFYVPSQFPSWMESTAALTTDILLRTQVNEPDQSAASTHPSVDCVIENGTLKARLTGYQNSYPALPFNATCSSATDSVTLHVKAMDPDFDISLQSGYIEAGDEINVTKGKGLMIRTYPIDSDSALGIYPSSLPGVVCAVVQGQTPTQKLVRLRIAPQAVLGTRTCSIPQNPSGVGVLTINLDQSDVIP